MAEKTIKHASFWYTDGQGVQRTATRGDTVEIGDEQDLQRGELHGAFATDKDLAEGSPFAQFLAARPSSEPDPAESTPDQQPEETGTQPARNRTAGRAGNSKAQG